MAWSRIDDGVPSHPKILKAGPLASWLWVCGNCYCAKHLTDGFIPQEAISTLSRIRQAHVYAARLVSVGLWKKASGGYVVHDYHDYNDTKEEVLARQQAMQEQRKKAGIASGLSRRRTDKTPNPQQNNENESGDIQLTVNESRTARSLPVATEPARPVLNESSGAVGPPLNPIPSHPIPTDPKKEPVRDGFLPLTLEGENGSRRWNGEIQTDLAWENFKAAYPAARRHGGFMANQAFIAACLKVGYTPIMASLERQKQSEDWKKGMVPNLEKWVMSEMWIREPETPSSGTDAARAHFQKIQERRKETAR